MSRRKGMVTHMHMESKGYLSPILYRMANSLPPTPRIKVESKVHQRGKRIISDEAVAELRRLHSVERYSIKQAAEKVGISYNYALRILNGEAR